MDAIAENLQKSLTHHGIEVKATGNKCFTITVPCTVDFVQLLHFFEENNVSMKRTAVTGEYIITTTTSIAPPPPQFRAIMYFIIMELIIACFLYYYREYVIKMMTTIEEVKPSGLMDGL